MMAYHPRYSDDAESATSCNDGDALLGDSLYEETHRRRLEPLEFEERLPHRRRSRLTDLAALALRRIQTSHFRTKLRKRVCFLIVFYLAMVGFIHIVGNFLQAKFPDDMDWVVHRWLAASAATIGVGFWLSDETRDIHPVRCHSHNDYGRNSPLFDAISAGCPSVEADIWHQYQDLYVGHREFQLHADRTLRSLYIDPLIEILKEQSVLSPCKLRGECDSSSPPDQPVAGVFRSDPEQPLVLLIDFKSSAQPTWRELQIQLSPLRERNLITYFNGTAIVPGPVVVVATGNAPFANMTSSNDYRDVFYDAPLAKLADMSAIWPNPNRANDRVRQAEQYLQDANQSSDDGDSGASQPHSASYTVGAGHPDGYDAFNSYYASASFTSAVGRVWGSRLTQEQLQLIRAQVRGAHQLGLKVRYWGVPAWPIGLRNHIWHILIREGVDVLSVDDLRQATTWDWRRKKGLLF